MKLFKPYFSEWLVQQWFSAHGFVILLLLLCALWWFAP